MQKIMFITFLLLLLASFSTAGLVIEKVEYSKDNPKEKKKIIYYMSKNCVKELMPNGTYNLWDLNEGTVYMVNPSEKTYYGGEIEKTLKVMMEFMKELMKGMEKAVGKPEKEEKYTVKTTGETANIAGYLSTKYAIYKGNKLNEEIWVSEALLSDAQKEIDYKKLKKYLDMFEKAMEGAGMSVKPDLSDKGYIIKSIDYSMETKSSESVEEVIKVEKRSIPDKEFQLPAGYKKKESLF